MGFTSSRYGCTIGAKEKGVKFFLNFFFRVVWARGCGPVGVGASDEAGWMEAGLGWGGLDSSSGCGGRIELPGLPQLQFGLPARVIWIDRLSGFQAPRCARGM